MFKPVLATRAVPLAAILCVLDLLAGVASTTVFKVGLAGFSHLPDARIVEHDSQSQRRQHHAVQEEGSCSSMRFPEPHHKRSSNRPRHPRRVWKGQGPFFTHLYERNLMPSLELVIAWASGIAPCGFVRTCWHISHFHAAGFPTSLASTATSTQSPAWSGPCKPWRARP